MTERAPKTPIDEALQRRISDALSADDGLAGDPELSAMLSSNKGASSYTKDLARINKWLVSWPVPEPTDDAFEALATRIEQRLGETLPGAASTFFGPPDFDDDDATRDATAGLLGPAPRAVPSPTASPLSAKKGTLVGMPLAGKASAIAPPRSPLAPLKPLATSATMAASKPLVAKPLAAAPLGAKPAAVLSPLAKKIAEAKASESASTGATAKGEPAKAEPAKTEPAKTEPAKAEPAKAEPAKTEPADAPAMAKPVVDPRTTADLPVISSGELELVATPSIPPEAISIPPDAISIPPEAIAIPRSPALPGEMAGPPAPPPAPPSAKKKKRKSKPPPAMLGGDAIEDRISIPMPAPISALPPAMAPVSDLSAARAARDDEPKRRSWWPMLAAAAVIALAVASGVSFFGGGRMADEPMTATATIAPAEESDFEATRGGFASAPMPAAPPVAAMPDPLEAPAAEAVTTAAIGPAAGGDALELAEMDTGGLRADDSLARDDSAPRRGRSRSEAPPRSAVGAGGGGLASAAPSGDGAGEGIGGGEGRAAGGTVSGSTGTSPGTGSSSSGGGPAFRSAPSAPARPSGPMPESPSREDVRDALEGVRPQVEACFGDSHGLAEVVVIAVSSGRVTTATVSGRMAGTPVGSCIARAVRAARMPPFSNDRFEVHYQYRY